MKLRYGERIFGFGSFALKR
jgi:hypothetical protein